MTSIFDVADCILSASGALSPMKLQKLCYYAQAWSLVWDDKPLFSENIEAWRTGPVCRELYEQTRGKSTVTENDVYGHPENLSPGQKETVNTVLDFYGDKDAQWLGRLACMEEPWKLAKNGCDDRTCCNTIVTLASMSEYYSSIGH